MFRKQSKDISLGREINKMRKQIADTSNSLKYEKIFEQNHKNRSKVPIFDVVYVLFFRARKKSRRSRRMKLCELTPGFMPTNSRAIMQSILAL